MNERSLRVLEFCKIKDRIKKYARTNSGKAMVEALEPFDNVYEINNN